jgi:hypothetical protein
MHDNISLVYNHNHSISIHVSDFSDSINYLIETFLGIYIEVL